MQNACPDELVCDMAETYRVLDWRALPLVTAATLAQGLPPSSRTKRQLSGAPDASNVELLLALIADRVGHFAWMFTKDGQDGVNHPPSIYAALAGTEKAPEGFDSGEDFIAAWAAITGGEADG